MSGFRQIVRLGPGNKRGFTLVELMIVVAIIGILASIAIPLYNAVQARARIAKAQADVRSMASAISIWGAHTGLSATSLAQLTTTASNGQGLTAGPFIAAVPSVPSGWTPAGGYGFATAAGGFFTISASGDGVTASVP